MEMTERLYYTDSYRTRFSARVAERLTWEGHPAVILDRTAFYPTSGGQPADQGRLAGVAVHDVAVRDADNAIVHVLSAPLPEVRGETPSEIQIEGLIDWPRRFDHMQQHTGQHVLSAAFEQSLDIETVGFHLGTETSTIDIDAARLAPSAATQVERLANQIVWEDRPVNVRLIEPDELAALSLRHPPVVEGPVRIVEITGPPYTKGSACNGPPQWGEPEERVIPSSKPGRSFDVNPCGGTHVARTGEIGLIKIVRLEYRGQETRVEFLCGERAWRDYLAKNEMIGTLTGMLTVGHWELDQAVERLQIETKRLRQELRRAHKRLLEVEASELAETAQAVPQGVQGPYRVVWQVLKEREPGDVRALAQELIQRPSLVALLVSVDERTHLCFACSEGLNLDMAALLRRACASLEGKGGGRPCMAQGSAPATDVARVQEVLAGLLSFL
jgi:alanyl-tRNA synthetase